MIIRCNQCHTAFEVDDRLIKPEGVKVRCAACRHVFKAMPPLRKDGESASPVQTEKPASPKARQEAPAPYAEPAPPAQDDYPMPEPETVDVETTEAPEEPKQTSPKFVESSDDPSEAPEQKDDIDSPQPSPKKTKKGIARPRHKQRTTFRKRLMVFAMTLIGFIALIIIPVEFYRPIQELHRMINTAKSLIAGLNASFTTEELNRMNEFALVSIEPDALHAFEEKKRNYYFLAFNMMITDGEIPSPEDVLKQIPDFEAFGGRENFDYPMLETARDYWIQRFENDPGIVDILSKYKKVLVQAVEDAERSGFQLSSIMIMLDSGKKVDFFEDHIAFILDSQDWTESSYCGEPFEITYENEFWRNGAVSGLVGYDHNPVSDPDNWYLPRFDEDDFGTWFSVWLTRETVNHYNIISIDFNAGVVKKSLLIILYAVVTGVVLLFSLSFLIANWFSKAVTRPIRELTRGAEEVAKGNYDYMVPVLHEDELGQFTERFNDMTRGQKQRDRLMQTMEKFLSKELAEKAAESGLVFGGKKSDCTVMFTDFAGFSTITRKMAAADAVEILNAYFEGLIPLIKKYGGFPDKYIGDAIVAIFGAPLPLEDHAERAVACAIEMQWKMRDINSRRRREGKPTFEMRIGLNSGEVLVGAIGCDQKLEYTSIGETTNLANRMESICDIGHVMIAEGTYHRIKQIFFKAVHIAMQPDLLTVKGYPKPVAAYRIYVDNRNIEKRMDSENPLKSFYAYTEADHDLKYSPQEVPGVTFKSSAKYRSAE